ncbi:MAG: ATP-binding protein [Thermodesulfobacteriota bacterium]|nr:ATP-binding protein [Thermodesulfobacteriota bacterium]
MADPIEFESKSSKEGGSNKNTTIDAPFCRLADRKLLERPSFSFRLQVILGFLVFFILSMVIIIGSMVVINRIQKKLHLVQTWERYLFDIEQARRWEKNYFLYGTNLNDAVQSARNAKIILSQNLEKLQISVSPQHTKKIVKHLDAYIELLHELVVLEKEGGKTTARKHEIEITLRKHGKEMVAVAASLASEEQNSINEWLDLIQRVPVYSLVVLLFLIIYVTHFLSQRFMKPLNRLVDHTQRIATGDFTPVTPIRKYRDEFTTVEVAINRMLKELDSHQTSMLESHKLRAIGTLTAGVAHELNNPLNNIMLTAHLLLEDYKDLSETEQVEMINDIIGETARSRSIVRNLLDFTRESESVSEPIDLGALVDTTTKLALNQAKVSGVNIEVKAQPKLPQIRGDKQQLKQVFLNLILNALDAVGKNGKIEIRVENAPTPGFLAVHVQDNGCGIPGHILPHIFDPFFTTKSVGKGTGLGLSVSQGIVTKHGGRIKVASEEGKSTTFTVMLPFDRYSRGY